MERTVKYWVIDVDGTMTDAGIYYDETGNEIKKFCTKDAAGIFAARTVGMKIIILTGRESAATIRRMQDLKVDFLFQNINNKEAFLKKIMEEHGIQKDELAYIGDDLNDLPSMKLAGYIGCPNDSCKEILDIADYISVKKGGHGAVRDIIEHFLRETDEWNSAVAQVYGIGV